MQYRETDLEFIERLAAEEGSYYFFEHTADTHTLHFTNDSGTAQSLGTLLYEANPAGDRPEPALWRWDYREQLRTSQQTLRDYTFTNPRYSQEHQNAQIRPNIDGQSQAGNYEKYDYPGRYKRDAQGQPFTQYRQEFERRESEVATAQGDDQRVIPGYRFTLKGHRREDFNQGWLVVGVVHRGRQTGILEEESGKEGNFYENEIKLIPQTSQWRPTPRHRPVVDGPQIAHVVGPAGEEIYCDEWGRVKVQFPWDRLGQEDEHSSCWVRVSQGWAGAQFGNMAIPRIGQEIIVDFLEGDPDQPIITGRTYHSTTEPPYALPDNKTRMTIKSKTHKGDGFNELRFEDEKGIEEVFIHAEKDQNNVVKHDETTKVGNDRTENIGHDEEIHIGHDRTETVGHDEDIDITHDRKEHVGHNETITIDNDRKETVGKNETVEIGRNRKKTVGKNDRLTVKKNQSIRVNKMQMETVGLAKVVSVGLAAQESVGGLKNVTVGANYSEQTVLNRQMVAGKTIELVCGKSKFTMHKDGTIEIWGNNNLFDGSKLIKINGKLVDINGGNEKADNCVACKQAALKGNPVNAVLGIKVLRNEVDFTLGGLMPLSWSRSYYSDIKEVGWLGQGWRVQGSQAVIKKDDEYVYIDEQGREFPLPILEEGEKVYFRAEQMWVERSADSRFTIRSLDGSVSLVFDALLPTHFALSQIVDANGNTQRFSYDATGLLDTITDGNGRVFEFVFNELPQGTRLTHIMLRPQRIGDKSQTLVSYDYNAAGDLSQVRNAVGEVVREFSYTNHVMVSHKNASGLVATYEYDDYSPAGKVLRSENNLGERWVFDYQAEQTTVTDVLGRQEIYRFDGNNEITEYVGFDGKSEQSERDKLGRVLKQTDSNGRTTEFAYNDKGQITEVTRPDQLRLSYGYDDSGYLIEQTDVSGNKTQYTYDDKGNLLTATNAVGDSTQFDYAPNGLRTATTDPLGNCYQYRYNTEQLLETAIDEFGNNVKYQYNDWGLVTSVINACNETHYRYNDKQQLTEIDYEDGGRERFEYDKAGRMTTHYDAKGNPTRYEYAYDDLPTRRVNALGAQFSYRYDKARRLHELYNENNAQYQFSYDALDRLVEERAFDDNRTTYDYNDKGELTTVLEYGNAVTQTPLRTTAFAYDKLGRLTRQTVQSDEQSQSTAYAYDRLGRLKQLRDEGSLLSFVYDRLGRYHKVTAATKTAHKATLWL